ncbi:hypothetical protein HGRIS_011268 [Hohenbuehelia grisea]|uniref:Uncharacterized protein n=1 Tax=Hohenbuehelia grisea TaxID=104357 RepID=A0ABR3JUJ4_9AGAR
MFSKHPDSRLYIDKMYDMSSRFANWDPGRQIQVGDFGKVNKKTGEFRVKGNIFTHQTTKDYAAAELSVEPGAPSDTHEFVSLEAYKVAFDSGPTSDIPGLATAALKHRIQFTGRRGAVLVLRNPRPITLKGDIDGLPREALRGKGLTLVVEVTQSPDYFMFLSHKSSGQLRLTLQASVPVAGVSAGGEIGAGWYHDGVAGVYKSGSQADHAKIFTPLYHLLKLDESDGPIRGFEDLGPSAVAGEECWMPATPPWKSLDSDGEFDEEESDDSVL